MGGCRPRLHSPPLTMRPDYCQALAEESLLLLQTRPHFARCFDSSPAVPVAELVKMRLPAQRCQWDPALQLLSDLVNPEYQKCDLQPRAKQHRHRLGYDVWIEEVCRQ